MHIVYSVSWFFHYKLTLKDINHAMQSIYLIYQEEPSEELHILAPLCLNDNALLQLYSISTLFFRQSLLHRVCSQFRLVGRRSELKATHTLEHRLCSEPCGVTCSVCSLQSYVCSSQCACVRSVIVQVRCAVRSV